MKKTRILVLEVEDENMLSEKFAEIAAGTDSCSLSVMIKDSRWNLVTSLQTSLIGQFMGYLEVLSGQNSCNPVLFTLSSPKNPPISKMDSISVSQKLQSWARNNGAAWEFILRLVPVQTFVVHNGKVNILDRIVGHRFNNTPRLVPFFIRALSSSVYQNSKSPSDIHCEDRQREHRSHSRLFCLLQIAEKNGSGSVLENKFVVSEWQLFAVFIEEACHQVTINTVMKCSFY